MGLREREGFAQGGNRQQQAAASRPGTSSTGVRSGIGAGLSSASSTPLRTPGYPATLAVVAGSSAQALEGAGRGRHLPPRCGCVGASECRRGPAPRAEPPADVCVRTGHPPCPASVSPVPSGRRAACGPIPTPSTSAPRPSTACAGTPADPSSARSGPPGPWPVRPASSGEPGGRRRRATKRHTGRPSMSTSSPSSTTSNPSGPNMRASSPRNR